MESYVFPVQFTLCVCLLLGVITQTTKVYFCTLRAKNKMSLWPYYMVICYLVSQTITFGINKIHDANVWVSILIAFTTTFNCFQWSCIILVQIYEWNLITCLVDFQKDYDLAQWVIKRDMYRSKVEPTEDKKFAISMLVNAAYGCKVCHYNQWSWDILLHLASWLFHEMLFLYHE